MTNPLKIAVAVLGVAGALSVMLAIAAGVRAFDHMGVDAAAYRDCRVVAGLSVAKRSASPRCDAEIVDQVGRGQAAAACDQALGRAATGAFAVQAACSAPVKRLVADRDAARRDVADRDDLVDQLKAERSADVARAEARGLSQAQRSANATRVLNAAPRDDRGRLSCDADCLSVLAGDVP